MSVSSGAVGQQPPETDPDGGIAALAPSTPWLSGLIVEAHFRVGLARTLSRVLQGRDPLLCARCDGPTRLGLATGSAGLLRAVGVPCSR